MRKVVPVDVEDFSTVLSDLLVESSMTRGVLVELISKKEDCLYGKVYGRVTNWLEKGISPTVKMLKSLLDVVDYDMILIPRERKGKLEVEEKQLFVAISEAEEKILNDIRKVLNRHTKG